MVAMSRQRRLSRVVVVGLCIIALMLGPVAGAGVAAADDGEAEPMGPGELFEDFYVWTTLMVLGVGALALISLSMSVASMAAYLTFTFIAVETGDELLTNILYVTLVLLFVGLGFKLWRTEGGGFNG